jgi:hypothetical protein
MRRGGVEQVRRDAVIRVTRTAKRPRFHECPPTISPRSFVDGLVVFAARSENASVEGCRLIEDNGESRP